MAFKQAYIKNILDQIRQDAIITVGDTREMGLEHVIKISFKTETEIVSVRKEKRLRRISGELSIHFHHKNGNVSHLQFKPLKGRHEELYDLLSKFGIRPS